MYWLRYLLKEPFHALRTAADRELIRLFFKYGDKQRQETTSVAFGKYQLRVPDTMSFLWQYKELFADGAYAFDAGRTDPVIIDCGANIGMSILYFKRLYPASRISAFEASPEIAVFLRDNLAKNKIDDVNLVEKAVWTDNEGIWFGSEKSDASSIYLGENKILVPSVRLRDVLLGQDRIDLLKIDIEGAEIEVLKDCHGALGKVQNLFVEFHSYLGQPQRLGELMQVLEMNGFRYHIDTEQHRKRPFQQRHYRDNYTMDLQLNIWAYRD